MTGDRGFGELVEAKREENEGCGFLRAWWIFRDESRKVDMTGEDELVISRLLISDFFSLYSAWIFYPEATEFVRPADTRSIQCVPQRK